MPPSSMNDLFTFLAQLMTEHAGLFESMGSHMFRGFAVILISWYGVKSALARNCPAKIKNGYSVPRKNQTGQIGHEKGSGQAPCYQGAGYSQGSEEGCQSEKTQACTRQFYHSQSRVRRNRRTQAARRKTGPPSEKE